MYGGGAETRVELVGDMFSLIASYSRGLVGCQWFVLVSKADLY